VLNGRSDHCISAFIIPEILQMHFALALSDRQTCCSGRWEMARAEGMLMATSAECGIGASALSQDLSGKCGTSLDFRHVSKCTSQHASPTLTGATLTAEKRAFRAHAAAARPFSVRSFGEKLSVQRSAMDGRKAPGVGTNIIRLIAVVVSALVLMLAAVAVLAGLSKEAITVVIAGSATAVGVASAATLGS
jgi:hypothetical protein